MNSQVLIDYINTHNLVGIKAGRDRKTFLEIRMVTYNNRIIARSWGHAEKSWYTAFQKDEYGEIICGDKIYRIKATVPHDLTSITEYINQAYLAKYDSGDNSYYARGIVQLGRSAKTMEFIPV